MVGGGLAGAAAALELVARGVETRLVCAGPGATALTWGTIDVAGASPLRRGGLPLREARGAPPLAPLRRLEAAGALLPWHPYSILFHERSPGPEVKGAAAALDAWLAPAGLRVQGSVDAVRWLADVGGAVRAADLALSTVGEGDLATAEEIALVELPGLPGHEPRSALRVLAAELGALGLDGRLLRHVRLPLPPALQEAAARPPRLARALEDPDAWTALAPALAGLRGESRLLLLPPVLGLERPDRVLARVRELAGTRVAELVGAPPLALAGVRLQAALDAALAGAGVAVVRGRASGAACAGGRVTALEVRAPADGDAQASAAPPATRLALDVLVLATGRFVGGGLADRGGALVEPLLGLPLYDLAGRRVDGVPPHRLVRSDYEGEQPLFAAGVRVDTALRPLGPDGAPRYANVFAAGDLLGGFDPARDRTGLGVALLSGRRAGIEAAAAARQAGAA